MTSFEDSHYTLLFRYIYGARVIQWFSYSKHLHVNRCSRQSSKWSIATSLSPKCYSANVPLDFCTTADFEIKYFSTKALLAFWAIPNWFSKFCRQNGYLNSKPMLRWDSHLKLGLTNCRSMVGVYFAQTSYWLVTSWRIQTNVYLCSLGKNKASTSLETCLFGICRTFGSGTFCFHEERENLPISRVHRKLSGFW